MILTLKNKISLNNFLAALCLLMLFWPWGSEARGLELSVSPTLFEMSAAPGQVWKSQVKVINSNPYPLTVYAQVMNFAPQGEAGQGKFVPVFEDFTEGTTLAEWIDIDTQSLTIEPEKSMNIPFIVQVPEDVSPGGHFAAILIGTRPPENDGMRISTSQVVTSLFFVRVDGDVIEEGSIREFRVENRFAQEPKANFSVRFENKGNVHIQPQGQIEIFNMWGKERGLIPINHQTHFGNVLPDSIRNFKFSWAGEPSISDIGRYKAVLTLGYGVEEKKFVSSATYFYVVPVKALLLVSGSLLFAGWFISWAIKAYVRRMLALSGVDVAREYHAAKRPLVKEGDVLIQKRRTRIEAPLHSGWSDLKSRLGQTTAFVDTSKALVKFVIQYKLFFVSIIVFTVIFTLLWLFISEVSERDKKYEVTIENEDQSVTLSSEEIIYEQNQVEKPQANKVTQTVEVSTSTEASEYKLELINAGDISGAAAALRLQLEEAGYSVDGIGSDFSESRDRSVVIYSSGLEQEALIISREIGNALLSADEAASSSITVFIGNDFNF